MPKKRKRRLTEDEVEEVRDWMATAAQGRKPTIRQIARRYGVNQPSVVKSLDGWKGIRRGRPEPKKKSKFSKELEKMQGQNPIEIEGFTSDINPEDIRV